MLHGGSIDTPLLTREQSSLLVDLDLHAVGFGGKTIGFFGSISLLMNNIMGSGIAVFPGAFQTYGYFATITCLVFFGTLTAISSWMVVFAIRAIPGNSHFARRIEYTTACQFYFSKRGYVLCQVLFQLSLLVMNMSNIIQTAQAVDSLLVSAHGQTCGLQIWPGTPSMLCPGHILEGGGGPFAAGTTVVSVGLLCVAVISVPLGYLNLDDNIIVQNISMVIIVLTLCLWYGSFMTHYEIETSRVPMAPTSMNGIIGMVLFNFALNVTVPSWLNEKKEKTSTIKCLSVSVVVSTVTFITLGLLGGMALSRIGPDETLLSKLSASDSPWLRWSALVYPVASNLSSIPVFGICMRYNLVESRLCSRAVANFISMVLPWFFCVPLFTGAGFNDLVNVGGSSVLAIMNFIVPPLLLIAARDALAASRVRCPSAASSPLTPRQQKFIAPAVAPPVDSEFCPVTPRQRSSIARTMLGQKQFKYGHSGKPVFLGVLGTKSARAMLVIMGACVIWATLESVTALFA